MTEKLETQSDTRPEPRTRAEHGTRVDPGTRPEHGGEAVPIPAHAPTAAQAPRSVSKAAELTTSKVLAGGMAAATSAVLGSHFGAFGTVGGAAFGSVVTTIGANLYQRSLERARDRVARQIPMPATLVSRTSFGAARGGSSQSAATAGATDAVTAGTTDSAGATGTVHAPAATSQAPAGAPTSFPLGRLIGMSLVGALLFFALGLGVITGIEWAKGSPLSGGTEGTSVGQALSPASRKASTPADERKPPAADVPSTEPSATPEPGSDSGSKKSEKSGKSDQTGSAVPTTPAAPVTPTAPITPSAPLPLPGIGVPSG
ncbi:MAG TPA: hypothetical protein VL595_33755 [Pseudonocardia sp.]|jgi:hypothetical protein|nr:hypothetical protein [Pseudonocardia sp.]